LFSPWPNKASSSTYNGYAVVVNVCGLVKLLLELGVLPVRPDVMLESMACVLRGRSGGKGNSLDTTGMQRSFVDTVGNH
jgi:hypothetical protein